MASSSREAPKIGPVGRDYPRDLIGYAGDPPDPKWPGGAKLAVQIVVNYEEGGERCLLHGDGESEAFLSEIVGASAWPGERHMSMESLYEYGARSGFWRLRRLLADGDPGLGAVQGPGAPGIPRLGHLQLTVDRGFRRHSQPREPAQPAR